MVQIGMILMLLIGGARMLKRLERQLPRPAYRRMVWAAFIVYLLGNLYFTLLSRTPGTGVHLILQPFHSYVRLFEQKEYFSVDPTGFAALFLRDTSPLDSILLNILLYVPMGYCLSLLFPRMKRWHIVLIGLVCSLLTETAQFLLKMGWCETDDVLHNTLGTILGVWAAEGWKKAAEEEGVSL